ncbi:MAG: hypothetical protein CMJ89_08245 [Planctomycetes bacterium]|jgi:hypothetical protein|nr:hypothetical protein [Planctomycetota bacterium]
MRRRSLWRFGVFLWPLFALPVWGLQTESILLRTGDPIVGVGRLETIARVAVIDDGAWYCQAGTDHPSNARDAVVLRHGFPAFREGDFLAAPPGARVRSFHGWDVDAAGNLLWELTLSGPGIVDGERRALYWNGRLLARRNQPAELDDWAPGTVWNAFGPRLFGPGNTILVAGSLWETGTTGPREALVAATIDSQGNPGAWTTRVAAGWTLASVGLEIRSISQRETSLAFNARGEFLWSGKRQGPNHSDGLLMLGLDHILAQEGNPAPVEGRSFASFEQSQVALNDFGEHAFSCNLNVDPLSPELIESNYLLVKDGRKFAQEGDLLSAMDAPLDNPQGTPLFLTNSRDLFWGARVRETPTRQDQAYMRNYEVIVREGRTFVDGQLVVALDRTSAAFRVSKAGRFFLGQVELEEDGPALLRVDYGAAVPVEGCDETKGTLEVVGGYAIAGSSLRIAMGEAQAIGSQAVFVLSRDSALDGSNCGITLPLGELLLRPPFAGAHFGPIWVLGPVTFRIPLPFEPGLIDSVWYAQGFFYASNQRSDGTANIPEWKPTNGLRIEVGAP